MDKSVPVIDSTFEEMKTIIKQENNINGGRLQSLRLPKELNLGGTKPKKVYTPNLNAIRNKDKQNHSIRPNRNHKNSQKRSLNNSIKRENNKRPKYIYSEGVFSQGIGEVKSAQHIERSSSYKDNKNSLTMPKLSRKDKDSSATAVDITSLVDDKNDFESESENEYDPIMLPLKNNKESFAKLFKIKQEFPIKIKCEDGINENISTVTKSSYEFDKSNVKIEKFETNNLESAFMDETKEFDEDNPAFSLLQVPNSFFGKIWSDDPKETNLDYSLKCFPEGEVGKICIRKSGKMKFVIQNIHFDLSVKDPTGLTELAVQFPGEESIALEPSLVTLGTVTEKLVVTPEWNTLFERAKRHNKFYW